MDVEVMRLELIAMKEVDIRLLALYMHLSSSDSSLPTAKRTWLLCEWV
jgi:hypothetical protein